MSLNNINVFYNAEKITTNQMINLIQYQLFLKRGYKGDIHTLVNNERVKFIFIHEV